MALKVFTTGEVLTASDTNVYLVNTLFAKKTADTSKTSTTVVVDDPHLTVAVASNSEYEVSIIFNYTAASNPGDFKYQLVTPAGCTFVSVEHSLQSAASSVYDGLLSGRDINTESPAGGLDATTGALQVTGLLTVGGTAGNFKVQWAQNSASGTATILKAGSHMVLHRVA